MNAMTIIAVSLVARANCCIDCGAAITAHSRGRCITCGHAGMKRGVPDDFADVLKTLGSAHAAKHYRTSLSTLTRWRRECGMSKHERAKPCPPRPASRRRGFEQAPQFNNRDLSMVGQAADFLRRFGAINRCDHDGKFNHKGDFWRRNHRVVTPEHLIKVAVNLGFRYEYSVEPGEVPAGFDAIASHGVLVASSYFGMSRRTVARLKRERCPTRPGRRSKPIPDDLGARAPQMSLRALSAHYNAAQGTIIKWLREAGISIADRKHMGRKFDASRA